jgi:hypothetical protein
MMKNIISTIVLLIFNIILYACPVCERNQPKLLKGIVHGKGPDSNWDYVSIWITAIIAILTLIFTIKYLIQPGEKNSDHIKYSILN